MLLLEATDLTAIRTHEGGTSRVLDGADLTLAPGEIVDVGGPSGVGKSTLLLVLARLLPGARGHLALDGREASEFDPREWRSRVLLVPQTPALLGGTVREALRLPFTLKVRTALAAPSEAEMRTALDDVGLGEISLQREARRLSVGQATRVGIARALLARPDVLLLDEPDANLDDDAAGLVSRAIADFAAKGSAVVRVRHRQTGTSAHRRLTLSGGRLQEVIPHGS